VAAIEGELDSAERVEWLASRRLDPDDADKADIRHALLLDLLVRLLAPAKKGRKLPAAADFLRALPWREEYRPSRPTTQAELRAKIDAAMTMLGGRRRVG
jgi:hypothetical protein